METRFKGQKLQIPATRIKALPANFVKQDNAKVKVQYIQNHQIVEKNITQALPVAAYATTGIDVNEVEAENVEYLDESTNEEQPGRGHKAKEPFKDTFYPNAIHCLIDLYKRKYCEMKGKTEEQIRIMCVWDQIAKDMNECLFRFTQSDIKEKFKQLRTKYFCIGSSEEADAFKYFDQLHDLYQDKFIDAIAAGGCKQNETEKHSIDYIDAQLMLDDDDEEANDDQQVEEEQQEPLQLASEPEEHNYQAATVQEVTVQTHQDDEIAHKEHEFIDMVEKELQAIVEGRDENVEVTQEIVSNEMILHQQEEVVAHEEVGSYEAESTAIVQKQPIVEQTLVIKREKPEEEPIPQQEQNVKRLKLDTKISTAATIPNVVRLHVPPTQQNKPSRFHIAFPETVNTTPQHKEMKLAAYNIQQERRHQEKMELLRKSLELQERALETQRHLMEELIKRL